MRSIKTLSASLLLFLILSPVKVLAQDSPALLVAPDYELQKEWVDSIYGQMTLEEKVGQLFMMSVASNKQQADTEKALKLLEEFHLGGLIFSTGTPTKQVEMTNKFQAASKVPLLIAMDAEWGAAMRLDSTLAFPWNMALGAIEDTSLIRQTGAAIGRELKRLGVQLNFAPVVDINTNPSNPIIGNRSFGEDRENVTGKALAFVKGMTEENILVTAKHFPGHGDTSSDSHKTLPILRFSRERLDSMELYPYRQLIKEGLPGVMVGHLDVPILDERGFPASLSKPIVTDLLKGELRFQGLIVTDALAMKGATIPESGSNSLAALLAGNDILLMPSDISQASQSIINAYKNGVVTEDRLRHSVKKILYAKYKVGLNDLHPVSTDYLYEELNTVRNKVLYEKLVENAITVVKNESEILPIKDLENTKIAYVPLGNDKGDAFFEQLEKYTQVDKIEAEQLDVLLKDLESYHLVIVGLHQSSDSPYDSYKMEPKELHWLQEISKKNEVVLSVFTSPYALLDVEYPKEIEGILVAYQNQPVFQRKAAQVIFGALVAKGKLPVTSGVNFPAGTQIKTVDLHRLSYGLPESVGMNSYKLKKVDSLIQWTLKERMTPGVQVLIARKGKVVYNNSAGYHTYAKKVAVEDEDVYDLASLTKILGTLPLIIELVDKDELDLETKISQLLPGFRGSNKEDINLRQMLSHYARLQAWIPFYRYTFDDDNGKPSSEFYRYESNRGFDTKVAEGMYIRNSIRDSILNIIYESELRKELDYRYSDLPYYLLKKYLENIYGTSLDYLTQEHFFNSLGANRSGYLPLNKFEREDIVPTAMDEIWRKQLLHGYVHDEGAALLGGIGGHAGIFANANDVAKMMQMYLNGGYYGGRRYFTQETFDKFNTCYYCQSDVRRGVGFDKPQLEERGPTCGCVSMQSFGHSGFTGTFTWADPNEEIVYVFLSNRIHPSVENRKLISNDIRSRIQKAIYEAIDY